MQIEESRWYRNSLLHLGFRPFFILAGLSAALLMLQWLWFYTAPLDPAPLAGMPPQVWHAHEMIYGYTLAVIAGFLLTSVRNWTGVQTLKGLPLLLLVLLWVVARLLPLVATNKVQVYLVASDLLFDLALCLAVIYPVIKVRQWKQLGIVLVLVLLCSGNLVFYLDLLHKINDSQRIGLIGGLYFLVTLILIMGRRVIPFFIEKGVGYPLTINNPRWLDLAIPLMMGVFIVAQLLVPLRMITALSAAVLFGLNVFRLYAWHSHGIWRRPLLWSLYIAYAWITLGFGMTAVGTHLGLNPYLALHAFAVGGIGLMTVSMMSRVALGHTGRNVFEPPAQLHWVFGAVVFGAVMRVIAPVFAPSYYSLWVVAAQVSWSIGFVLFCIYYIPMLVLPRVDGRYG